MRAHIGVMDKHFPASRTAALDRLAAVTDGLGRRYAAGRNADLGPDAPPSTSALSPYLRRRMLLEAEAVHAAIATHGPGGADKFVQEVFWRSYFKGHLETRPVLWSDYAVQVAAGHQRLATESGLRRAYQGAIAGTTGITCFDDWSRELVTANWLHNHTRMWFASIWIFTLGLPWALGAEFFLRHLIDGDPASNTLSWRWVAGLHTRGRPYAARAENIRRYTGGRYDPTGLNENPVALDEPEPAPPIPLPPSGPVPAGEVALLLHLDDLHPESLPLAGAKVARIGALLAHPPGAADRVRAFDTAAMQDAVARATAQFGCPASPMEEGWADGLPVVAAWAPVGPSADALPPCIRIRRPWDTAAWPKATRGYYQVKAAIPAILATVTASPPAG